MYRIILLALLAAMSLLHSGCAYVNLALISEPGPLQEKVVDGEGDRKILLMDVTGIISEEKRRKLGLREEISMVDEFRESLKKARGDKKIAGLVIRINSPGGTITASDILHHEILSTRRKPESGWLRA
jgi:protease-4